MDKQEKIALFHTTFQQEFYIISSLRLWQEHELNSPPVLNLEIELLSQSDSTKKIALSFFGVRNLRLAQPSWSLFQMFLKIQQISDRQWEDLNYEIKDSEEDSIEFICRDLDFAF